jgi:hypothetical protein
MDGGASIIAFVTCGLKSIEFIYKVISLVEDGPSKIQDLQNSVLDLRVLLERIRDGSTFNSLHTIDGREHAIIPLLQKCTDDIRHFENKITQLIIPDGERLHRRLRRRLNLAFSENDVVKMLTTVMGHRQALNLHVSLQQTTALTEINTRNIQIHTAVCGMAKTVSEILSIIRTQTNQGSWEANEIDERPGKTHLSHSQQFSPTYAPICIRSETFAEVCPCQCHTKTTVQSPLWAKPIIGSICISSYATVSQQRRSCNVDACHRCGSMTSAHVTWCPPFWGIRKGVTFDIIGGTSLIEPSGAIWWSLPRIRSQDSLPFYLIKCGSVDRIQSMFENGSGSIYDVDESGWSLLYVGIQCLY